jgi:phosphomannomutase
MPTPEAITASVASLRADPPHDLGGLSVSTVVDLALGYDGLPPTEGLLLRLNGARVIVRPSGTEPKVKCYLEVVRRVDGAGLAIARDEADITLGHLDAALRARLDAG